MKIFNFYILVKTILSMLVSLVSGTFTLHSLHWTQVVVVFVHKQLTWLSLLSSLVLPNTTTVVMLIHTNYSCCFKYNNTERDLSFCLMSTNLLNMNLHQTLLSCMTCLIIMLLLFIMCIIIIVPGSMVSPLHFHQIII